jgi:hypothetical protein
MLWIPVVAVLWLIAGFALAYFLFPFSEDIESPGEPPPTKEPDDGDSVRGRMQ